MAAGSDLFATQRLKIFGGLLLGWYVFWGFAIKPKSVPPIFPGQLTVWIIYAGLLWVFYRCLARSSQTPPASAQQQKAIAFTWRGFWLCFGLATAVTCAARLWLHQFAAAQVVAFFSFYVITGLALLVGAILYSARFGPDYDLRIT